MSSNRVYTSVSGRLSSPVLYMSLTRYLSLLFRNEMSTYKKGFRNEWRLRVSNNYRRFSWNFCGVIVLFYFDSQSSIHELHVRPTRIDTRTVYRSVTTELQKIQYSVFFIFSSLLSTVYILFLDL